MNNPMLNVSNKKSFAGIFYEYHNMRKLIYWVGGLRGSSKTSGTKSFIFFTQFFENISVSILGVFNNVSKRRTFRCCIVQSKFQFK